jgi:hypothetical protein
MQSLRRDDLLALRCGDILFECDPRRGGRIVTFALDDINLLSGPETDPDNFGSTFWTSPQSDWGWPPPFEIDHGPYTPQETQDAIVLTSLPCQQLEISVAKRFSAVRARQAIELEYRVQNIGSGARWFAPWEVSRVLPGGTSFFPTGHRRADCGPFKPLPIRELNGVTWYEHRPDTMEGDQKLFTDGAQGWIAHLAGERIFIKTFSSISLDQQAPGEGQIEIYASRSYVEVEQQGAFTELSPGENLSWKVQWYLRKLPLSMKAVVGSQELADFVRKTIG